MHGRILSLLFSFLFCVSSFSQHSMRGQVLDEQDQPIDYATVALLNPGDSILAYFGITNTQGNYQIKGIQEGEYIIQFSYVGMKTVYRPILIPLSNSDDLGDQRLQASVMKEIIVEAELIPVQYKNDTLEFDVRAFPTRPGAATEELLRQLPGVEVDNAGNIKAEGESVVKVLVDGKEFFDDDPKVATKNLPADALSKVQVIDRKTEQAVFSGIDDGIREKTINLELKEDRKKGYFGEVKAGGGTQETYRLTGNLYRFSQTTQTALLGQFNNINELGFTNKDNNQFGENNRGINQALAAGVNLSYNPSEQNRYFISYLGNRRQKDLLDSSDRENFLANGNFAQIQESIQEDIDRPHKLNFGVRQNFNEQQRLIIDGGLTANANDIFTSSLTRSLQSGASINTQNNETTERGTQLRLWSNATYIAKSKDHPSQFKIDAAQRFEQRRNRLDWTNDTRFFNPIKEELLEQFQTNDQEHLSLQVTPSYLREMNTQWSLSTGINLGLDEQKLFRREGQKNDQAIFEEIFIPNFSSRQGYVSPSLGINRVGKNAQLNIQLAARATRFEQVLNATGIRQQDYFFFTPSLSYRNEYRSGRRVNVDYRVEVNMPTVQTLFPVQNVLDALNIIQGNLELKPEQNHQFSVNWALFDAFSFTGVSFRLSGNYVKDKIRWAQSIDENLVRRSSPINTAQEVNFQSYLDFSTPLRSLGLNLNITSTENWNRGIVLINTQENINTNFIHQLEAALENRNNDKLAIRLSAAIRLTDSRFSIAEVRNNIFFNTNYTGQLNYSPNRHWNFETSANIINYNARSFEEAVRVPLLNASIRYFFGQAEKVSLSLIAFDILNQYTGIQRISNDNVLLERRWNTLTQYFMLDFNYRFR